MQSGSSHGRLASKALAIGFLLLLLTTSMLFVPETGATRQFDAPKNLQDANPTSQKRQRPEFVPGEVLVRFKQNQDFEGAQQLAVPNNDASVQAFQKTGAVAASSEQVLVNVERFEGSDLVDGLRIARMAPNDTMKAVAAFQARDDVLYAEPNYILHGDTNPNDPKFMDQSLYGLTKIGAPQAWDITQGNRSIVVGVIDEGIDINHPDLLANIWTNPSPGSIPGINGDVHGYDFRDNTGTILAESHATHVAGTIGAVGNNGVGVVGVNWLVSLMSLRFISQATNSGSDADAIKAYNYAKQMRDLWVNNPPGTKGANIRVLNASYGGGGYSQAAADSLNAVGQSGILFVAAAGNETTDADLHPHYPSGYSLPNVVSVAATDQNDLLASFSNFGAQRVLLGAPGVGILSTTPNNTYSSFSGTSMATPHVAGAAALLCAANPNLSVNQLRALLAFNGDSVPALQGRTLSGRRLNVFKSLQAINEGDTTPPGTVGSLQVASQNGRQVNLSWTASGDDGAAGQASLYDISFVDQTTNVLVPLTTVAPAVSGSPQTISVNLPYRHLSGTLKLREFDNVGNEGTPATVAVNVPPNFADPYFATLTSNVSLTTGGTALGLTFDDRYRENYPLPFAFSYFGQLYNSVTISTNGNLYFSTPPKRANGDADDVPSSISDLSQFKMIAGMWDDLDLSKGDVYVVQPNAATIIFRWQGVPCNDQGNGCTGGPPINFEIELRSDGTITTRYGDGNINLRPVVGISAGEPDAYVMDALTSELSPKTLTNAPSAVFTPRATVQFTSANYNVSEGSPHADILLSRIGDSTSSATISFTTSDTAGNQNCNAGGGKASSRCDYTSVFGTAQFAAGETSKTISIPIVDDAYVESSETFTLSLNSGFGTSLGAQTTATVTINDNDINTSSNPLDVTGFFVRQQYLDFLSREPDTSGLNFWTGNINNCSPQPACTEIQRINTSAAFFISVEFQDTGYLVERIYKVAYGNASGASTLGGSHQLPVPIVRFNEFLPDTQEIGQGVVVNVGNWQQQLENNKQTFTAEFVQRSRFTTAFPASMTAAQFVDALNTNSGNALSTAERNQLVNDLTTNVKTRAQVLRAVAEDSDLNTAEFNRAFVLMQYFGYLRRNPNDLPDTDYTGYDFWLTKLNQFNGNYVAAEMVKSFLVAGEYRQRFGP